MLLHKVPFDWKQRAILEGRGFHVDVGAFSTGIVGGGNGTVLDQDQPEAVISVPSGTSIIPIRVAVQVQPGLMATDSDETEIVVAWDQAVASDGTGTATAETCLKMYDGVGTSLCTATSAYTANMTNPTLSVELARKVSTADLTGTAASAYPAVLELVYTPDPGPILVGPCCLIVYWGGTVATVGGFAQIEWLEYLTSDL